MDSILRRWGQRLCLINNGEEGETFYAFFQSLQYKNKMYLRDVQTPMGVSKQDYFLYIGPPERPLAGDSQIKRRDALYQVMKSEPVYIGEEPLYIWAVVRKAVDEDGTF